MSTVILLSSSPPTTFARSPTPVDLSSPPRSTAVSGQGRSPSQKRFKTTDSERDGFRHTFTTARQVLAEKTGAKNIMIRSPARTKFRASQDKQGEEPLDGHKSLPKSILETAKITKATKSRTNISKGSQAELLQEDAILAEVQPCVPKKRPQAPLSPLLLEKATPRRLDWTPPKVQLPQNDDNLSERSRSFQDGVMDQFVYPDAKKSETSSCATEGANLAKRRRVMSRDDEDGKASVRTSVVPELAKLAPAKATTKRTRSPAKKTLTITGLATSNYSNVGEQADSPMMQYLTSTQAQTVDRVVDAVLQTKVKQTKAAAKKVKDSKKKQPKSLLLSPNSAMKSFDEQVTIFGSASQLVREDSPDLLRETIMALNQSESLMLSDPFSSPQRTQPISIENTPHTGTARFRKTRNLWTAADRDEDNALLHVDTVDLTDTPAVRAAFAGKDVMLQPTTKQTKTPLRSGLSLHGGFSPLSLGRGDVIVDIGDIDTPCIAQQRTFSTTVKTANPRRSRSPVSEAGAGAGAGADTSATSLEPVKPSEAKEPRPSKPNYAGFATHDLQKQIKAFGFKNMRKRENMIKLLDRCWEEKYGPSEDQSNTEEKSVPFGDFLSKVHDLSARPEPKVKKPRTRKKNDSEKVLKEKPPKKPRQRKKKDAEVDDEQETPAKPKATRKRKPKTPAVSEEFILDVDDIEDTITEEQRALGSFEDWAKPTPKPKRKTKPKIPEQPPPPAIEEPPRPPTPPATLPLIKIPTSPTDPDDTTLPSKPTTTTTTTTTMPATPTATPDLPSISSQLTAAITHQSKTPSSSTTVTTNHHASPTWHEKILLYDPIALEDLAAWLNTEGLGAVGEDREVSALEVREWCEARGICCLWKGGWRGNKGKDP